MKTALASLSDAIAAIASAATPWLVAIQVGPHAHVTGVAWADGSIVTTDRGLPARDGYSLVLPGGDLIHGRLVRREPSLDLAVLRTDQPHPVSPLPPAREPALGSLAVVVGTDFDGTPTMRLTAVRRQSRTVGQSAMLDLTEAQADPGALVLDPQGAVLGIVHTEASGAVSIVPHRTIVRLVENGASAAMPLAPVPARPVSGKRSSGGRGWFGIALQPVTVPELLVPRARQTSGRLVVGITANGPADDAGLRVGDVLLSFDGHSTSGANALRTFLQSTRAGNRVEARILRGTSLVTTWLTVAEQP
jgi:S1-C subfamily serine protease